MPGLGSRWVIFVQPFTESLKEPFGVGICYIHLFMSLDALPGALLNLYIRPITDYPGQLFVVTVAALFAG